MIEPTKFEFNPISTFPANAWKLLEQSQVRKQWKFNRACAKLIRIREAHIESAHQIWVQSDQLLVCKCTETDQSIRGQEAVRIQCRVAKSSSSLGCTIMNLSLRSPWRATPGLLSWCPIFKSRHCNSFEDRSPVDFIYGQCWKFPQVRWSEAYNFGEGLETFCWFFFNFMFMIWDSRHKDLQLFDGVSNTVRQWVSNLRTSYRGLTTWRGTRIAAPAVAVSKEHVLFCMLWTKLQRCTVEVYEWTSNFIPHFIMDVITYPCWD